VSDSKKRPDPSRRAFLATAAVAASAAVIGLRPRTAHAALPHLSEGDPLAKSLGYRANHNQVDSAKFPAYKPGERCALCRFFLGKAGQTSGFAGCQIFPGYAVNANGWCASFNARS
jgi:hypothetical protein